MILTIGQEVWAPKVAGVPAHIPANHVYELVGAIDEDEGSHEGYELKHDGHTFVAQAGTIKHLQDVSVCKQCGSDKIQFPMWVDNLQVVQGNCEGLDPFCPDCNETMTRSFHCNLKEYLEYKKAENEREFDELADRLPETIYKDMNIFSAKGSIVMVTEKTAKNGYPSDEEKVAKYLKVGQLYTVDHTVVHDFSTEVYLEDFPKMSFNSVNFVTISDQNDTNYEENAMRANED